MSRDLQLLLQQDVGRCTVDGGRQSEFAAETGKGFYDQVQDAIEAGDEAPFFDFEKRPADWEVPEARPKAGFVG